MMKIGFIGLGHMGHPMVSRLLKAGYEVKVFDISEKAVNSLAEEGASASQSVADAAQNADVIFTMLQTSEQVEKTCLGKDGIFANAKPHCLYIDSSSIEIKTTKTLHEEALKHQIKMLDAPVSGGVAGAQAGTLTIMVGGADADYEDAKPLLEKLGKKIVHAGAAGHGQAAKICNNLILGISMIGVSEGFALAEKLGLDAKKFFEISSNASGQCWSMTSYCPVPNIIEKVPSNNHYLPGFSSKMMLKDLLLAESASEEVSASIPLGSKATELYKLFINEGHGDLDFSAIIKMIAENF